MKKIVKSKSQMRTITVRIKRTTVERAGQLAEKEHISRNQWTGISGRHLFLQGHLHQESEEQNII